MKSYSVELYNYDLIKFCRIFQHMQKNSANSKRSYSLKYYNYDLINFCRDLSNNAKKFCIF